MAPIAPLLLSAASVSASCRASAAGAYSADVRLSRASGVFCFSEVQVFEGEACAPDEALWSVRLHCSETRRLVVTDDARLVSLLNTRASRRDWEIVRVISFENVRVEVRSLHLEDLPGLPAASRRPGLELHVSELRVLEEPPLAFPVATLYGLAQPSGSRPARAAPEGRLQGPPAARR